MGTQATTHTTLLARLGDGADSAAWQEFHDRYGELLRGFARRRGLQPADTDDVAQDVLLALIRIMPDFRYDPAKGKFRSYLKTAALRAILKRSRQRRGEVDIGDIEEATRIANVDPEVEEAWEAEWRQYHLRLAMRAIDVEFDGAHRQAFQRYAVEGRGARETAAALNMSLESVYQAKSRVMKRLAQLIELQIQDEG
ncbi:MAG: sigma-70 family RNA polymerase sigma factor [Phycisphaerales bacterium]|nr:MAG: sigma-70 family RNA polymerase sigma factor [Phycisphaerales bacterium]